MYYFRMILRINSDYLSLNSINQLIFVMVKYSVFFAVRTEFLNIIQTSFGFKGLIVLYYRVSTKASINTYDDSNYNLKAKLKVT
jgi:hypothetical protein